MAIIKPTELNRFLKNKFEPARIVLVYGPDIGLVSEKTNEIIQSVSKGNDDPFSLVKLDSSELVSDQGRLANEVLTIPMFGGKRTIWVKDGNNSITPAVKLVLELEKVEALVIIEAGDLRKGTSLRKTAETDKAILTLPCYADNEAHIANLINEVVKSHELTIKTDARDTLQSFLGGDRLASRSEIEKLCLYARGSKIIEIEDVLAVVGDASALALDKLVDSTALGNFADLNNVFERIIASGTHPSVIAGSVHRHFQWLYKVRVDFNQGKSTDTIIQEAKPPIFFRRKKLVNQEIVLWTIENLQKATEHLDHSILQTRLLPDHIGHTLVFNTLMNLAMQAKKFQQNRNRR